MLINFPNTFALITSSFLAKRHKFFFHQIFVNLLTLFFYNFLPFFFVSDLGFILEAYFLYINNICLFYMLLCFSDLPFHFNSVCELFLTFRCLRCFSLSPQVFVFSFIVYICGSVKKQYFITQGFPKVKF